MVWGKPCGSRERRGRRRRRDSTSGHGFVPTTHTTSPRACCMPGRPTHVTEGSLRVSRNSVYLARPRVAPTRLGHRCDAPAPMRRVHRRVDRLQRSTRSLVRGTPSQQMGRPWRLSARARESSEGIQQQKASCGATRATAKAPQVMLHRRPASPCCACLPAPAAARPPAACGLGSLWAACAVSC